MRSLLILSICTVFVGCSGAASGSGQTFVPGVCTSGTSRCSGTQVVTCNGQGWVTQQDCSSNNSSCTTVDAGTAGCASAPANPNACAVLGSTRCVGSLLESCNAGLWVPSQDCNSSSQACELRLDVLDSYVCAIPQYPTCSTDGAAPTIPALVTAFNDWVSTTNWVQIHASANETISAVQVSINGGVYQNMNDLTFAWALNSTSIPATCTVQFQVKTASGAIGLSDIFNYPSGSLASGPKVNLVVTSARGPGGNTAPVAFDSNYAGVNIADWSAADYMPTLDANFAGYLKGIAPGMLRWPANTDGYTFSTTATGAGVMTPAMVDAYVALCRAVGAQPYIGVSLSNSAAAAALVQYANVTKKYGVSWWHLGDTSDYGSGAASYASAYMQTATAMRQVDSNIHLVGGETAGPNTLGTNGSADLLSPVLSADASALDGIGFTYVPLDSNNTNPQSNATATAQHLLQQDSWDWTPAGLDFVDQVMTRVVAERAQYVPSAKIFVEETLEDGGPHSALGLGNTMAGALWASDEVGRFLDGGASGVYHYVFKGLAGEYYGLIDENNVPRPEYYAAWMYAQLYGDRLVYSASDQQSDVSVHAALRSRDGTLRVFVTNKTPLARTVRLYLSDFVPRGTLTYTLESAGGVAGTTATLNSTSLTLNNLGAGAQAVAGVTQTGCPDNELSLQPYTAMMLVFIP